MTDARPVRPTPSDVEVRHVPDRSTFEILWDGEVVGHADYRISGDDAIFTHTFVDPVHRGKGFAEELVAHALDHVRREGLNPVGQCWYVADHLAAHPQ